MAEDASTNLTIDEVLKEEDDFRLAIRGFAVIEDSIVAGIAEAFKRTMPSELKRLSFRARLALFRPSRPFQKNRLSP